MELCEDEIAAEEASLRVALVLTDEVDDEAVLLVLVPMVVAVR